MTDYDDDVLEMDDTGFDDAFDDLDGAEGFDWDDGPSFEDDDPDEWDGWNLLGAGLNAAGNQLGAYYKSRHKKKAAERNRPATAKERGIHAVLSGLLGGLAKGGETLRDSFDPAEPEYETGAIAEMETVAEGVVEASDDAAQGADAMARIAFGPTRADPRMRSAMLALRREAARAMAQARRSRSGRSTARLVPHALRRTVVLLQRMNGMGHRPSASLAVRAFRTILARMARSSRLRQVALGRARAYAARARRGGLGPVPSHRGWA